MSFPAAAKFPASAWDGSSDNRSAALDGERVPLIHRPPSAEDYSQIVAEVQAIENQLGAGGLSGTTATAGFIFLPKVAGAPTGVPANVPTGFIAACYDTTDHKIYVYDGAWKATAALV